MPFDALLTQVRRGLYASLGAISLPDEELDDLMRRLVARGEDVARARLSRAEAVVREGTRDGIILQQTLGEEVVRQRRQIAEALNLPTHETVRYLSEQIDHLSAEIEALATQRAAGSNGAPELPKPAAERRAVHETHDAGTPAASPAAPQTTETFRLAAPAASLSDPEPWPGYATLNVGSVTRRLAALDETGLLAVRAYEERHGRRVTVLRAVAEALGEQ